MQSCTSDGSLISYEVSLESRQSIESFLERLMPCDKVAIEATNNSYFLQELIKLFVEEVVIVDPKKVREIAESSSKTDLKDAEILARLLAAGFLPEIYVPPPEVQAVRKLLVHRHKLVEKKTSVKNQVHALLGAYGFSSPVSDLFGAGGKRVMEEVKNLLPADAQVQLTSSMRLLNCYEEELKNLNDHLADIALHDPYVGLLMTVKGVNVVTALSISAYIVDIDRFASGKKLAAYAGIVPVVRNSGGKTYCGSITKKGPPVLRWALIEVVQTLVKEPGPFRNLYRRMLRKKGDSAAGRGKAIVACANKLARVIWGMLTSGEAYREYNTALYERKISKMEKAAQPYQHSLEENWKPTALTPSREEPPILSEVESPVMARLWMIHEVMEKAKQKQKRKKKQKAA